ncbi:hypothetical protein DAHU10_039100 [Hanseniaspora uvarum]|nr:hypothetical protein DAHU10_039100 [Hanseniaspora uvarum]
MSATAPTDFFLAPIKVSKKLCRSMTFTNLIDSNQSGKLKMNNQLSKANSSSKSFLSKKSKKQSQISTNDQITMHDLAKSKKVVTREDIIEFNKKHGASNKS